jgi:hypothetical protein
VQNSKNKELQKNFEDTIFKICSDPWVFAIEAEFIAEAYSRLKAKGYYVYFHSASEGEVEESKANNGKYDLIILENPIQDYKNRVLLLAEFVFAEPTKQEDYPKTIQSSEMQPTEIQPELKISGNPIPCYLVFVNGNRKFKKTSMEFNGVPMIIKSWQVHKKSLNLSLSQLDNDEHSKKNPVFLIKSWGLGFLG